MSWRYTIVILALLAGCKKISGLDNLRFIEPVGIGDTIRAKLSVKQKTAKEKRPDDKFHTGVVKWAVEITNQDDVAVAVYDILTLVRMKSDTSEVD